MVMIVIWLTLDRFRYICAERDSIRFERGGEREREALRYIVWHFQCIQFTVIICFSIVYFISRTHQPQDVSRVWSFHFLYHKSNWKPFAHSWSFKRFDENDSCLRCLDQIYILLQYVTVVVVAAAVVAIAIASQPQP